MDNNLDELEEKLKKEDKPKKQHAVSGRSIFVLKEIIKNKSGEQEKDEKEKSLEEK